MDTRSRNTKRKRSSKKLNYFFWNGDLHKKIHINRAADLITAWNYPKHETVGLSYVDVKKNHEKAWSTKEVADMLNRPKLTLELAILNGDIEAPYKSYSFKKDAVGTYSKYLWSEKDVMEMHAFLCTVHKGRPRKDGRVTPYNLPTARELRALMRQETILYVKNENGEFVPTWQADHFRS